MARAVVTALLIALCALLDLCYVPVATPPSSRATAIEQDVSADGDGAAMPLAKLVQHGILTGPGHARYRSDIHVCTSRRDWHVIARTPHEAGARTFHFRDDTGPRLPVGAAQVPLSNPALSMVQPLGRAAAGPVNKYTRGRSSERHGGGEFSLGQRPCCAMKLGTGNPNSSVHLAIAPEDLRPSHTT